MKKEDLKALIFAGLLLAFETIAYFGCKFSPFKLTILTSSFDAKLPFIPAFSIFYYLWYVYLLLIPFVLYKVNKKRMFEYAKIVVISVLLASIIFIFFPTTIERGVNLIECHSIFEYIVKFIYFTDTPNLCCLPSMHCVLCFIFIYMSLKTKELKWYYKLFFVLTSLGIVASTLFIKQHVIWDVFAAIAVVTISVIISKFSKLDQVLEKYYEHFNFK